MARWVKISTLGMDHCELAHYTSMDQAVKQVKQYLIDKIAQVLPDSPDLIVLPEWCDIPKNLFEMNKRREYVHERGTEIFETLAQIARQNKCYITYPTIVEMPDKTLRNTVQLLDRNGEICGHYNKNHLVISEIEEGFLCGKDAPVIECDFGRVAIAICFDLNFEPLRLKYVEAKPEVILFPSMYHGGLMQQYWAYSCRSYFVGSISALPCSVLSPVGHIAAASSSYYHYVTTTVNLDYVVAHLGYNMEKIFALRQKYGSSVNVFDPGLLGPVLISSESETISAADMAKEFDIELLDDYFNRSLAQQSMPQNIETI